MFSQALREDFAEVDPNGEKKAFVLSVAEINKFSGPGQAFPTLASRQNAHHVRTRFNATHPWHLNGDSGVLGAWTALNNSVIFGEARPLSYMTKTEPGLPVYKVFTFQ